MSTRRTDQSEWTVSTNKPIYIRTMRQEYGIVWKFLESFSNFIQIVTLHVHCTAICSIYNTFLYVCMFCLQTSVVVWPLVVLLQFDWLVLKTNITLPRQEYTKQQQCRQILAWTLSSTERYTWCQQYKCTPNSTHSHITSLQFNRLYQQSHSIITLRYTDLLW